MVKMLLWLICLIALFFAIIYLNEIIARKRAAKRYPPPGKLVDVGTHRLHIYALGVGHPTVVMEAGLGEASLTYFNIQSEVARFNRACSYDRAGLGWSDPGPEPRTYGQIVKELHTLLHNAGEQGPYVLVGHSAGGFTARLFAQTYPNEVAGLVLVDPSDELDEEWNDLKHREKMVRALTVEAIPASIGLYRLLVRPFWKRMKPGAPAIMLDYAPFLVNANSIQASAQEMSHWPAPSLFRDAANSPIHLGSLPLVVITATKDSNEHWIARHNEMTKLSTRGRHMLADCGHHILHEQPTLVVNAIRDVVAQAKGAISEVTVEK